jgi:hypothetical protein
MSYTPTTISFAPSYRCNLSCAHCCVPGEPERQLPTQVAIECVKDAPDLGITSIGLTGGEPMLDCGWVAMVTRAAADVGLEVDDLSTNGVWWSDAEELEKAMLGLRDAGFGGGFHLSVDAFHAESGGEKQAEFIRTALRVFGKPGNLNCAERPGRPAVPALGRLARRLGAEVVEESNESGRLVWGDAQVAYFRLAAADVGQRSGVGVSTGREWFGEFDCFGHDAVYVDPSGIAHFCLGFATYTARPLWLGSVERQGLAAVVSSSARRPLIRLLCTEGPHGLRRVIEERDPEVFPEPWASPCAFCHHCLTDAKTVAVLREAGVIAEGSPA